MLKFNVYNLLEIIIPQKPEKEKDAKSARSLKVDT